MKRFLIVLILTLFVNILCLPLWTEGGYGGFIHTLCNKEVHLDLLYSGKILRAEPFQYKIIPRPFYATWVYEPGNNIHRASLSLRAREKWQKVSLQLKAQRDGKITMLLRGPDVHDEYGSFYSVLTDWQNIQINGKTILPQSEALSFKRHFSKGFSVKKGDILHIEAEFRRHRFSIHDFTGLKSGKVWYIITGNLLLFALIYRILSCIRGGGIQISNALFLAAFSICCVIPMINISDAVRSEREFRMLAVKPELKEILGEKFDYGRKYENWFNDHFCGRVALTKMHDVIRNKLSRIIRAKNAIYFKANGWEFMSPLVVNLSSQQAFIQSIVQQLVQLNQFCQQNKIKLYVLEIPRKESVYKELIEENYGFDEKTFAKTSQVQETIRNRVRANHIPYIYPYDALRVASKQELVFFKWVHHWTDWGAFVGYRELMKEISKDFPDIPVVSLNDYRKSHSWFIRDQFTEGYRPPGEQLRTCFNYGKRGDPSNRSVYNYYDHKDGEKMVIKFGKFTKDFTYLGGKHKIMLIGTSQNDNLSRFIPYSAAQTKYIRVNLGQVKGADEFKILKLYKKDILDFKPEVLVLSINTDNLPRISTLCSDK